MIERYLGEVDEPMHYPWTYVIGLEADSDIIRSIEAYLDDITLNRVDEVIRCIPCTSNNRKFMLNSGK